MAHPRIEEALTAIENLESLVRKKQATAENIEQKTTEISVKVQKILSEVEQNSLSISKEDAVSLMASYNALMELMAKEISTAKGKLQQQAKASQVHKSYSNT